MGRHRALNAEMRWFEANSRSHAAEADGRPRSLYLRLLRFESERRLVKPKLIASRRMRGIAQAVTL